jgi:hypothetical protein
MKIFEKVLGGKFKGPEEAVRDEPKLKLGYLQRGDVTTTQYSESSEKELHEIPLEQVKADIDRKYGAYLQKARIF